jgi:hypothetical protein
MIQWRKELSCYEGGGRGCACSAIAAVCGSPLSAMLMGGSWWTKSSREDDSGHVGAGRGGETFLARVPTLAATRGKEEDSMAGGGLAVGLAVWSSHGRNELDHLPGATRQAVSKTEDLILQLHLLHMSL